MSGSSAFNARADADGRRATTPAHRIWAGTEADNVAEQRSLENCGFRREGVLRGAQFRDGDWRDAVVYGVLRGDL